MAPVSATRETLGVREVVLREERVGDDYRYLGEQLTEAGTLVIEGQDLGPGVEQHFGAGLFEYEWSWRIEGEALARLRTALGTDDVLTGLAARFSGTAASGLSAFLSEQEIDAQFWSRVGD